MNSAVLITGACGGIGRALCDLFAEAGYLVVGIDLVVPEDFPHATITCDIRQLAHSEQAAEKLRRDVLNLTGNRLDVLINNAAVQIIKPCTELTRVDWSATLDTNLLAPYWLTTLFCQQLRESRGNVLNIASIHAQLTKRHFVAYATSKGALITMTKALALELAPHVRVNAISPAATNTPMLQEGFDGDPSGLAALEKYHPMGRIAESREVAEAALFLAGNSSAFITGSVLCIDGGISSCLSDPA